MHINFIYIKISLMTGMESIDCNLSGRFSNRNKITSQEAMVYPLGGKEACRIMTFSFLRLALVFKIIGGSG